MPRDRRLCDVATDDAGEVDHDRQERHHNHQRNDARHREYFNASTAVASSASICSVTFIAPISAPIPAPTRPDTRSPAVRGPFHG